MAEGQHDVTFNRNASAAAMQLTLPFTSKPRTLLGDAWQRFRKHRMAMLGGMVFLLLILAVVIIPMVSTANLRRPDFSKSMLPPSIEHPMGTDDLGRDMLLRTMHGGRISIAVGVVAMLISVTLGTLIGASAGFLGGRIDSMLMRITDLFLALPVIPLLLLLIFLFRDTLRRWFGPETGIFILIVTVIGGLNWMTVARLVRGAFLSLKQKEFVEAAYALGIGQMSIMFKHILPNAFGPIIVAATLGVGSAIITESVLSFLGLGFPPDTPTWGRLLYEGQNFLDFAPWMVLWPGLLIFLTVLSINFVGDGLRDALDPRARV
ncbi:ABC transporter permease [Candidatus Viridilinea mediisalina]|uniref:Peptide ABC transporter permease n=1 Tax=Candidatus Viridilinea mediisalina TaxID=2024553 RepID=A0A2A6RDY0_9CHLR|nr:ABC transporter permease [Candidatus Viridilinea mediisalina]PDW00148.1 peptide ABC transporter permease [Candidatus Viridilinea mediisalina]